MVDQRAESDDRVHSIHGLILRLSRGEYGARLKTSDAQDDLDAIIEGLNMLAQTLQSREPSGPRRIPSGR